MKYIKPNNPHLFEAYCSIIYHLLIEDVPRQYFESKFKRPYNPDKHKFVFQSVGNRIMLSADGKTRLSCIHLGLKRSFAGNLTKCIGNKRYPYLYKILLDLHRDCFPFIAFNQILINKNNIFKPHKDSNNIKSEILVFSLGNFSGDLHIENKEYDTCMKPLLFNGKNLEHSVPFIEGTRYSILFYMI